MWFINCLPRYVTFDIYDYLRSQTHTHTHTHTHTPLNAYAYTHLQYRKYPTKNSNLAGKVIHTYNPRTEKTEAGGPRVQAYLGYIQRPCLKKHYKTKQNLKNR
jgi:hypothetical protein